jgi:excisionase family DNA binding protein
VVNITGFCTISIDELKEIIGQVVEKKLREFSSNQLYKTPPEKEFLTKQEVCQMLHVKSVTLWRYAKEGRLKQHRVGRKVFFLAEEVREALIK